jgi:hypothetical protein
MKLRRVTANLRTRLPAYAPTLLRPKLREIPELAQGCRVGQGIHVWDRSAVDHVPNGKLRDLSTDGSGNIPHLDDLFWHVMGAGVVSDPAPDAGCQIIRQGNPLLQSDEQYHSGIGFPFLANYKALNNFR